MTSKTALAIYLLLAAWTVPIIWALAMIAGNHIGNGAPGFILHMISWPFAWAASLMLGLASCVKWAEDADIARLPRMIGVVFSGISGLAAFPLGLLGFGRLFFPGLG